MDLEIERGERLFEQGKLEEAEALFLTLLERAPDHPEILNNLGVLNYSLGKHKEAECYLTKALQAEPTYEDALANLGAITKSSSLDEEHAGFASVKPSGREPVSSTAIRRERILLCCLPQFDNFVDHLIWSLKPDIEITKLVSNRLGDFSAALADHEVVWLEWGNQLAEMLTNEAKDLLMERRVICRIHSYEVLDFLADRLDFSVIDDLIFVAPHIREILLRRRPGIASEVARIHLVPNGIDLNRFVFENKPGGYNIAFLGTIDFKKDPMVLMQAFSAVHQHDNRFRLYIGGAITNFRYSLAIPHFAEVNGLQSAIVVHGDVSDVPSWLIPMQYIICSSLMEGHPVGLLEGMASGCKPLIYHFPGADKMYPECFLWKNMKELVERIQQPRDPAWYREFVAKNYSLERECEALRKILTGTETVEPETWKRQRTLFDKAGWEKQTQHVSVFKASEGGDASYRAGSASLNELSEYVWAFPEEVFDCDPAVRARILYREGLKQIGEGRNRLAKTTLDRACRIYDFIDDSSLNALFGLYRSEDNVPAIQALFKRAAVAALRHGDYDRFFDHLYLHNYAETFFAKDPSYRYASVDEDIHAFVELAAKKHPFYEWVEAHRPQKDYHRRPEKLKLGIMLEGFSQHQAPTQRYRTLARFFDRERFDITFYSRIGMSNPVAQREGYGKVIEELRGDGCRVLFPETNLKPMEQVRFLAQAVLADEVDVLFFQTVYFVPQFNFLSWLRLAFFQASANHQQPEYARSIDCVHSMKTLLPDQVNRCASSLVTMDKPWGDPSHARDDFGLPKDAVVLVSANRDIKYRNKANLGFWEAIDSLMTRHPQVYFIPLGLEGDLDGIPLSASVRPRVLSLGFRLDAVRFYKMADIYVDIFMHTSGGAMEAAFLGVPAVAIKRHIPGAPFRVMNHDITSVILPDTELLISSTHLDAWHQVMDRLISDEVYRKEMGERFRVFASQFEPRRAVNDFLSALDRSFREKAGILT